MKKTSALLITCCVLMSALLYISCKKNHSAPLNANDAKKFVGTWVGGGPCLHFPNTFTVVFSTDSSGSSLNRIVIIYNNCMIDSIILNGNAIGDSIYFPGQTFADSCGNVYTDSSHGHLSGNTLVYWDDGCVYYLTK